MDFLKSNRRFSFKLDGVAVAEIPCLSESIENGDELCSVYQFEGGLMLTNKAKKIAGYDAYEWVNYLENTSSEPTGIISELWDADITLPIAHEEAKKWQAKFPDPQKDTLLIAPNGSDWLHLEFYCDTEKFVNNDRVNHLFVGKTKKYAPIGGRSSEGNAPFFNLHKMGAGYIFAVGWTGQWNAEFSRSENHVTFRSGIENTHFRLLPGERVRTSSVVVMKYEGDVVSSQNKWRRLVKEHYSQIGSRGKPQYAPFCASVWGGLESKKVIERIDLIKKNELPFEYIWMDAGWYGETTMPTFDEFEGDWARHTGEWCVSPHIHPNGLHDVAKAVHDAGMKFLLWFEPERVIEGTSHQKAHPALYLERYSRSAGKLDSTKLLNLGNEEAWQYCYDTVSGMIRDIGIDCYRQDFNFSPLSYWRYQEAEDRQGINEIKHINGLYRFWDALLEEFPHLVIDNCASGGRRIDIETLRRSVPLWRSDFQCPANHDMIGAQAHHMCFNSWMPYSGTGSGRVYDESYPRSTYDSAFCMGYFFSAKEDDETILENMDFLKKYAEEYLTLRPYFSEDFYPLTEVSAAPDAWAASQFDRPSEGDGIVQVFKREKSPYETARFRLRAIDAARDYLITDLDGGEFVVSGKELCEKGFSVTLEEAPRAKIFKYGKI